MALTSQQGTTVYTNTLALKLKPMHYKGLCTDNRRAQRTRIAPTTPQKQIKDNQARPAPRPSNAQAGLPFSRDPERTWDELYTSQAWACKCKEDAGGTQELWGGRDHGRLPATRVGTTGGQPQQERRRDTGHGMCQCRSQRKGEEETQREEKRRREKREKQ